MQNPATLVYVEDNPQDVRLFQYALSQLEGTVNLRHFLNGRELLDDLTNIYAASVACVMVDLNMPFVNGFELIEALRAHEDFRFVPIIVFTNSNSNDERARCYALGANAYVPKPLEIDELVQVVNGIYDFWIVTNTRVM